jgi:hypothetical protein
VAMQNIRLSSTVVLLMAMLCASCNDQIDKDRYANFSDDVYDVKLVTAIELMPEGYGPSEFSFFNVNSNFDRHSVVLNFVELLERPDLKYLVLSCDDYETCIEYLGVGIDAQIEKGNSRNDLVIAFIAPKTFASNLEVRVEAFGAEYHHVPWDAANGSGL